jgi:Mrp family chromosome partitioning ATPase
MLSAANWSEASRQLSAASREGEQVFVITSQHRGEGRTLLALCLAQRLAEKQLRVTLIDADFRGPQLARQLKLLPACTWDDVLRGPLPLAESWIESVEDGVTLLPLKERADTTGLTGNPRLKEMLSLLRRTSDIVLIDAGSLEDFSDREVLALLGGTAQIDGALVVRDVRKTAVEELEQAGACLDALGIGRVDVVENFVK